MKDTHKLKTVIKILRDIDAESKNNYFTINKTKYFVNKNLLFKNGVQVGSIRNGVIIFNKPLIKSRKSTTKGTRKFKSTFKPVVDESESISNYRNTTRIKPVVNGSVPLMSDFSDPMEKPEEPVPEVQEPVSKMEEPVTTEEPVSEIPEPVEEPFDEHKEDL